MSTGQFPVIVGLVHHFLCLLLDTNTNYMNIFRVVCFNLKLVECLKCVF